MAWVFGAEFRCNFMVQIRSDSALASAGQSLYGAARIGDFAVNRNLRPSLSGWVALVVCVAALALSGCGRKGGLDLPPTAASASTANGPTANAAPPADTETEAANRPSVFNPSYGTEAAPTAPKGGKKPFILDPLLGN